MMLPIGSFARKQGDFARENRIRLEIVYWWDFSKQLLPTSTLLLLLRESIFTSHADGCTHRDAKCLASFYFFVFIEITLTAVFLIKKKKKKSFTTEHNGKEKWWIVFEKDTKSFVMQVIWHGNRLKK